MLSPKWQDPRREEGFLQGMGDTHGCRALLLRSEELQMVELLETGSPRGLSMQLAEEPMGPTLMVPFPLGSAKQPKSQGNRPHCICCCAWGKDNPPTESLWCEGHVVKGWENGTR